jgi:hypothetical protein
MMMRYAPFTSALGDKHSEARRTRYRFAFYHPGKRVKAGDFNGVIVDCDCAPFINRVLVAGSFCRRKIPYYLLSPFGDNRTDSSEKDRIRTIIFGDGLRIIAVKCG